uniref:DNA cross-link repair 1A protein n=1 Tax=Leptobrachium leishanense TaxID=445787 RepID=A0A8C5Q228_9ANUR
MSENEISEDDIWGYKSIRKSKTSHGAARTAASETGNQQRAKKAAPAEKAKRAKRKAPSKGKASSGGSTQDRDNAGQQNEQSQAPQSTACTPTRKNCVQSPRTPVPRHSGHCPSCQMPFSILLVETPRWHVSECLDTPSPAEKECPHGITCDSTISSHYKKFTHFQLAQSRAVEDSDSSFIYSSVQPCLEAAESSTTSASGHGVQVDSSEPQTPEATHQCSHVTSSQKSTQSRSPASSQGSVKQTSLDAWLSSPSKNASQGSPENLAGTQTGCTDPAVDPGVPQQDWGDRNISYSPLQSDEELFSDDSSSVKSLFLDEAAENDLPRDTQSLDRGWWQQQGTADALLPERVSGQLDASQEESAPVLEDWSEWDLQPPELSGFSPQQVNEPIISSTQIDKVSLHREVQSQGSGHHLGGSVSRPAVIDCGKSLTQGSTTMPSTQNAVPAKATKQMDIGVLFGFKPKKPALPLKPQSLNERTDPVRKKPAPRKALRSLGDPEALHEMTDPMCKKPAPRKRKALSSLGDPEALHEMTDPVCKKPAPRKRKALSSLGDPEALHETTDPVCKKPAPRKRKAQSSLGDPEALNENPTENGNQKRWKKFRQNSTGEEGKAKRRCPFYKKIPGTNFTVDAFQYGQIEGCSAYFLTHFHSDHYGGLTKKFRFPIYCSKITGNLVRSKLRVEQEFINVLPMDTECMVDNVRVVLLDANHCPGAVLLLFILPDGTNVLHTGDFRADPSMENYPPLIGRKIHSLYLDTTYCSPEYTFPPQQEVIQFAANTAFEMVTLHPRTLVVCGTYSVGKEKVFLAVAEVLGCKASMSQDKYKTMQCLESEEIRSLVTTDWHSTPLHILPMMQLNFKGLYAHLNKFSGKYDRVLAFKPTGWTYSDRCSSVENIRPESRGKVTLYGVPYSEHSSYLEMKRFVQWCKPQKIIPTVNMGSPKSRSTMEKHFKEWSAEVAYKPARKKP